MASPVPDAVERALADGEGVLRLEPCWVARDLVPPGRRLGLPDDAYDAGERGFICERWLGSTTHADNRVGPPDEGLSYLALDGGPLEGRRITLAEAVAARPALIMGNEYAATHAGLGRLAKIFDYGYRLPYHLHLRQAEASLVGRRSKDEAYYFPPGFDMGGQPETFFGVHPWVTGARTALLPYLVDWNSDRILELSRAYLQVPDQGFDVPSGVLHAPGTALTIELQEDSDVMAILQAENAGRIVSKEMLFKDVRREDRERFGEEFALRLIDWDLNGDPYFYEHRHLTPRYVEGSVTKAGRKDWIFYNAPEGSGGPEDTGGPDGSGESARSRGPKFSGKKLIVRSGQTYQNVESGVYNLFVLSGTGTIGGHRVKAGDAASDELLVASDAATAGVEVASDGPDDLVVVEFFGPDINPDAPLIAPYPRA